MRVSIALFLMIATSGWAHADFLRCVSIDDPSITVTVSEIQSSRLGDHRLTKTFTAQGVSHSDIGRLYPMHGLSDAFRGLVFSFVPDFNGEIYSLTMHGTLTTEPPPAELFRCTGSAGI